MELSRFIVQKMNSSSIFFFFFYILIQQIIGFTGWAHDKPETCLHSSNEWHLSSLFFLLSTNNQLKLFDLFPYVISNFPHWKFSSIFFFYYLIKIPYPMSYFYMLLNIKKEKRISRKEISAIIHYIGI